MAKILVVDDRATNREFLVTLLSYSGHRLFEASDGVQGLGLARDQRPDLIIVDIVMPSMDGYDFVRELRSDPEIAQCPVIFYTASYLESEARNLAQACGVRFIITKPAEPREILEKIDSVLGAPEVNPVALPNREFDREHLRIVTNKLSQKVDDLEILNAELEERVERRTAELAQANAQLRALNRRKDEMVAIVSHDLRSPLTGVLLVSELLKKKKPGRELALRPELLDMVEAATRRMIHMVNDLLDVARIGKEDLQLEFEAVRASEIICRSVEALVITAQAKRVAVETDIAPDESLLYADRLRLSQVFNNLLGNAVKFTRAGGKVNVAVTSQSDGVSISVSDTGPGIPAKELPFVFEKYKQQSRPSTEGEFGSGLGLAIVKQIVELHGGRVEVVSELNRGSTFTVFLPGSNTVRGAK